MNAPLNGDLLRGSKAIGEYLGLSDKSVQHYWSQSRTPFFKLGGMICARKSSLLAWIAEQERRSAAGS